MVSLDYFVMLGFESLSIQGPRFEFLIDLRLSVWAHMMHRFDVQMIVFSRAHPLEERHQRLFSCPLLDETLLVGLSKVDRLDVVDRGVSSGNGLATIERYVVDASVISNLNSEISIHWEMKETKYLFCQHFVDFVPHDGGTALFIRLHPIPKDLIVL